MVSMSTDIIKRCPFCGGEIKQMFMDKKTYEGIVWNESVGNVETWFRCYSCDSEFYHYEPIDIPEKQIEWWNTRKPLERIVERLEAMQDNLPAELSHCHEFYVEGMFEGLNRGIKIVKEEGGMNG